MGKKGRLLFKGDKPKKKSKKSKVDKKGGPEDGTTTQTTTQGGNESVVASAAAAATAATTDSRDRSTARNQQQQQQQQQPTIRTGTGTITTSGTVVTGHGTKFEKELSVGDAILVGDEMRIVTMRLSNGSLNLSTSFSSSLREPHAFKYVCKPRNIEQEQRKERQKQLEETNAVERNAFDIYGSSKEGTAYTYRERTENGSYRVKQGVMGSTSVTRGGLLDLRSKKTSDKYC